MKRTLIAILLVIFPGWLLAQTHTHQQGTIIRMRMTDCMEPPHRFFANMSGGGQAESNMRCPEYVLVADKVVYVISGKSSQLLPLAETTRFRFQKNEILIRIDDAPKESHFYIKVMMMRSEWERAEMLEQAEASAMIAHHLDSTAISNNEQ
jgi:hypothetical protein